MIHRVPNHNQHRLDVDEFVVDVNSNGPPHSQHTLRKS
jgi:hypothetical protein